MLVRVAALGLLGLLARFAFRRWRARRRLSTTRDARLDYATA
jgi:hypothetical protein